MKACLFCLVLATSSLASAADSAMDILHRTAAAYGALHSYDFRLTVQTVHGTDASERHYGAMGAGNQFRMEWLDGRGELRVGDGQTEWTYRPEASQFSKAPFTAQTATPISALAQIDQHVKSAAIARTEQFLVDGNTVPIYVIEVERDQWPQGSPNGAKYAMYRVDQKTFMVYKVITYGSDTTEIALYTKARWNPTIAEEQFRFSPPASAHEAALATASMPEKAIVGSPAPDFTLPDTGNHMVNLRELQGRVVVVDFWATWCGPCQALMPHLQKMHKDLEKKGLVVLGLDIGEDADTVQRYARKASVTFALLTGAEPDTAAKYYVEGYPTTFVIDRLGKIVFRAMAGDPAQLQAAVEKALGR